MTTTNDGDAEAPTFEAGLARLAEIVARLESGGLGLSESIDAYERGVAILQRLHTELEAAEKRVSVLVRIDDEGRPVLATTGDPAAATGEPAESTQPAAAASGRGKRAASGRARRLPGMDDPPADA